MRRTSLAFAFVMLAVAFFAAAAWGIQSAMDTPPTLMSRVDHDRQWRAIDRHTREALGTCRSTSEAMREACRARARAEDRVAKADLDALYFGTVQAASRARDVRAHASFDVARAGCLASDDPERTRCLTRARSEQAKILASAKLAAT
jgi:hypothetical protein